MARKFALRRIQKSELPFFQAKLDQARAQQKLTGAGVSKQKAINFDRDVIDQFYPGLSQTQKHRVQLLIYGPDSQQEYDAQPAPPILLQQKNWRIGGGAIQSPAADPGRFDRIQKGDYLFFEFLDDPAGNPGTVRMLILSETFVTAYGLAGSLGALFRKYRQNFIPLTEGQLLQLRYLSRLLPDDPLAIFGDPEGEAVEEALMGEASATVYVRRRGRKISKQEVRAQQEARSDTGEAGERLVKAYLAAGGLAGEVDGFDHIAQEDALAACDFQADFTDGSSILLDVKTTTSIHDVPFYMSAAELQAAAVTQEPYLIYRVSELAGQRAVLRISGDITELAQTIVDGAARMPAGVRPVTFSVMPSLLTWSDPVRLPRRRAVRLTFSFRRTPVRTPRR